jgi:hypothetical protein
VLSRDWSTVWPEQKGINKMARDSKRIKQMITLLEEYWQQYPDLRLAQIIGNCCNTNDPYYMEDQVVEQKLTKWIERTSKK